MYIYANNFFNDEIFALRDKLIEYASVNKQDVINECYDVLNGKKLSEVKKYMSIFIYTIPLYEKNLFFTDKKFDILYIENGEDFLENKKFDRKKYLEYGGGNFI